jgi:hypothetical protein
LSVSPWRIGAGGTFEDKSARPFHRGAASIYEGQAVSFDWQEFFKAQIEECRELERQAMNGEDRAFWRQAVARWEEQLRQAIRQDKEAQARKRIVRQDANANRALGADT